MVKNVGLFHITAEPKNEVYRALLRFAATRCSTFSLVWRPKLSPKVEEYEVSSALEEFLISKKETQFWPGTQLGSGVAIVRHYKLNRAVLPILCGAESLYSWLHPTFPEDLAIYQSNGESWLASVAHEKLSWISDASLSEEDLLRAVPNLVATPRS